MNRMNRLFLSLGIHAGVAVLGLIGLAGCARSSHPALAMNEPTSPAINPSTPAHSPRTGAKAPAAVPQRSLPCDARIPRGNGLDRV